MQNLREESFSFLSRNSRLSLNIAEDNKPVCHLISWKRGEAEAVDCSEPSLQVETNQDYRTWVKHGLTSSKVWEGEKKWRKYWDWKAWIKQFWLSIICHWHGWGDSLIFQRHMWWVSFLLVSSLWRHSQSFGSAHLSVFSLKQVITNLSLVI